MLVVLIGITGWICSTLLGVLLLILELLVFILVSAVFGDVRIVNCLEMESLSTVLCFRIESLLKWRAMQVNTNRIL